MVSNIRVLSIVQVGSLLSSDKFYKLRLAYSFKSKSIQVSCFAWILLSISFFFIFASDSLHFRGETVFILKVKVEYKVL